MFYHADGTKMHVEGLFNGFPAFLVCNGPSVNDMDLSQLARPGIVTMGLNNGPRTWRPDLWIMGDDVPNFTKSIYLDPKIVKFIPRSKAGHKLFDNQAWHEAGAPVLDSDRFFCRTKVSDCPSVVYFNRLDTSEHMDWKDYLTLERVYWGNHADLCMCGFRRPDKESGKPRPKICPECKGPHFGCRNVMFIALRVLYGMGVRTVFIVGADFTMSADYTYSFQQARARGAVNNNNNYYTELNYRFDQARPHFEAAGFQVYNCTPRSGLKSFEAKPLDEAVSFATKALGPAELGPWGQWRIDEPTEGLYDRKANEKRARSAQEAAKQAALDTITMEQLRKNRGM